MYACSTYNGLSEKEKLNYKLEQVIIDEHARQSDSLLYSIDSKILIKLFNESADPYQLVLIYTRSCPVTRAIMDVFVQYIDKIQNSRIYIITPNDQIFKYHYTEYLKNKPYKKYMLNSEIYTQSMIDVYAHSNDAKEKFISEICPDCKNTIGVFAMLFDKAGKVLFYTNSDYGEDVWVKGMQSDVYRKLLCEKIYNDITKITNKYN
jgi:hypothetical protein